jgi:hypothetical protein
MLMEQRASKSAKPKGASSGRASTAKGSKQSAAKAAGTPSSRGSKKATTGGAIQVRRSLANVLRAVRLFAARSPRRQPLSDVPAPAAIGSTSLRHHPFLTVGRFEADELCAPTAADRCEAGGRALRAALGSGDRSRPMCRYRPPALCPSCVVFASLCSICIAQWMGTRLRTSLT